MQTTFGVKKIAMAVMLAALATTAHAGNFTALTNGDGTNLTAANGGLKAGANNANADRFYLETTGASYLSGFDDTNVNGEVVAETLNYRAFSGRTTLATGTLTLLDWQVTRNVNLLTGTPQFTIFDFVYRDSLDNKLVFGSRFLNVVDNNQEVNFAFRHGFTGFDAAVAWTFSTDFDLRMYEAGRTDDYSFNTTVPYDADAIRMKADISVTEGNPWSGLYLVKTNSEYFTMGDALSIYQAGEEGQAVVGNTISGFVPTNDPTVAIPEPESFAMMLAGLGLMGFVAARRKQ